MAATATKNGDMRLEAARIAFALIRFEQVAAHPRGGSAAAEEYAFLPSWRRVPRDEVENFLVALPSPALLAPTTIRGTIALTLLHELSGERRRWAEKTLRNFAEGLDGVARRLGLAPSSRILLEFDEESHIVSFAGVREWSQQLPVQVGWNIAPLEQGGATDARMMLRRSDGKRFRGQSCMVPPHWGPAADGGGGAT